MNIYLAPFQGITLAFYRNLYTEIFGGVNACYAPFVSTTHMRKKRSVLFNDLIPEVNHPSQNLVPQILGNNGEDFSFFANAISEMGYKEINWNMGCPYNKVTRKKKGSGLMPHPNLINEFLTTACSNKTYDLSVKMRLGYSHVDEGLEVIEILNQYPITKVIIHGRTGEQIYTGKVDMDAFELLYKASKHPVAYNGDIFTINDYYVIKERFPTMEDIMIGRGALRDPFLPSAIKGIHFSTDEKLKKLKQFHDTFYNKYAAEIDNDRILCGKMKEFWYYLSYQAKDPIEFFQKVKDCETREAYIKLYNNHNSI